ncbi:MAG: hypothetical protein LKE64_03370 [Solobacterium sp.]|jgi:hypothetical protein|nr:hypothetical protein [Solobacterium sp.]MCH4049519.1 hypothetical protein [Solobacterium sp.]MCH4073203.1 hypothetical protein [Solobacterium sp.]
MAKVDKNYEFYNTHQNVLPIVLPDSSDLINDVSEIKNTITGKCSFIPNAPLNIDNEYIFESVQLIYNAIILYQEGYFDCAYYSLRESIEVSTTMIYIDDMPFDESCENFKAWDSSTVTPQIVVDSFGVLISPECVCESARNQHLPQITGGRTACYCRHNLSKVRCYG